MEPTRFEESTAEFSRDFPRVTSPVPSYRSQVSDMDRLPMWAREVAASLQHWQHRSRASSIISTRTGTTTQTALSDTRSIDLEIDGQHFRISRDGSKVTSQESEVGLPLYQTNVEIFNSVNDRGHFATTLDPSGHLPYRPILASVGGSENPEQSSTLSRNPSYTPGQEIITVIKPRAVSNDQVPRTISRKPVHSQRQLRRRRPIQLPILNTGVNGSQLNEGNSNKQSLLTSPTPDQNTRSAEAVLGNDNHSYRGAPSSPSYIGRNAPGLFPPAIRIQPESSYSVLDRSEGSLHSLQDDQATVTADSPNVREEGFAETYPPPAMESENDVSVHYTRLIRSIDRDHRMALHERDKDMAKLRERLHEQDTIFRQTLKGRDFIIDDHKARLAALETQMDSVVEKARNETEDVWENRWMLRDYHLGERMRRMEEGHQNTLKERLHQAEDEHHTTLEKRLRVMEESHQKILLERTRRMDEAHQDYLADALARRDVVWQRSWEHRCQELTERLQEALPISTTDLQPLTEPLQL